MFAKVKYITFTCLRTNLYYVIRPGSESFWVTCFKFYFHSLYGIASIKTVFISYTTSVVDALLPPYLLLLKREIISCFSWIILEDVNWLLLTVSTEKFVTE